jgi:phosphohistidine phosphatase
MDLYLVRHANAGERDPDRWPDDSQRPLTQKGIRRFKRAANGLVSIVPEVDLVLASPYKRAWQTAVILEDAGWTTPQRLDELIGSEPGALLRALLQHSGAESIALVGHEPHLSRFATALLGAAPWGEMKKGGVVKLSQEHLSLSAGASNLDWYLTPRILRKLR